MNRFPKLRSGAVSQYPTGRGISYSTWVGQFVGGKEQRFREFPSSLLRWVIELQLLSAREAGELRAFFMSEQGRAGKFEFEDPWTGTVYADCSFESDENEIRWDGEDMGRMRFVIRQNRTN